MQYQLLYISRASDNMSDDSLIDLMSTCSSFNKDNNITGMLLYINNKFIQVLEGDKNKVNELIDNIRKDSRNNDLYILRQSDVENKEFNDWSMGVKLSDDNKASSDLVDIENTDAIKKLLSGDSAAKQMLLTFYLAQT